MVQRYSSVGFCLWSFRRIFQASLSSNFMLALSMLTLDVWSSPTLEFSSEPAVWLPPTFRIGKRRGGSLPE